MNNLIESKINSFLENCKSEKADEVFRIPYTNVICMCWNSNRRIDYIQFYSDGTKRVKYLYEYQKEYETMLWASKKGDKCG